MATLGVNIDHIANVRQARRALEPDPVTFALLAELGGADGITVHLREDRRHIQDRDVALLRATLRSRLNLEMAATAEMEAIALRIRPDMVTLVPEKRQEVTTEGGLDVAGQLLGLTGLVGRLQDAGIPVSLFVDAERGQLEACPRSGARWVDLHTGAYAEASAQAQPLELARLCEGSFIARSLGLSRQDLKTTPPIRDWIWWKNKEALLTIGDNKPRYQQDGNQQDRNQGKAASQAKADPQAERAPGGAAERKKFLGLF